MTNLNDLPNADAHFMIENEKRIQTLVESRAVDKHFEQFEYAFEDVIIDQFPELAGDGSLDDEEDERRMDIVYDIMRRCITSRWTNH